MSSLNSTPNLVPDFDVTVHIVLDDFGKIGMAYRETNEEDADYETVVHDLLTGQLNNPIRVVAFNTAEGWARDISEDIAREVLKRGAAQGKPLARATRAFVALHIDEDALELAEPGFG